MPLLHPPAAPPAIVIPAPAASSRTRIRSRIRVKPREIPPVVTPFHTWPPERTPAPKG
jgi:hypothetical protein